MIMIICKFFFLINMFEFFEEKKFNISIMKHF